MSKLRQTLARTEMERELARQVHQAEVAVRRALDRVAETDRVIAREIRQADGAIRKAMEAVPELSAGDPGRRRRNNVRSHLFQILSMLGDIPRIAPLHETQEGEIDRAVRAFEEGRETSVGRKKGSLKELDEVLPTHPEIPDYDDEDPDEDEEFDGVEIGLDDEDTE